MKTVAPESVGMSSERLARIDTAMQGFVKDNQLPGIMTLIQRKGEIVHFGMYGMMDIENQRSMQEDAIFRIYSMTKPIASIALMMLLEEGRLSLNEAVAQYIPAFGKTRVFSGMTHIGMQLIDQNPPMTIHHLLTHTSGLSYGFFVDHPVEELYRQFRDNVSLRETPFDEFIDHLAKIPLVFQPGTRWNYSMSTDVVGYLVQVISGIPFADFLEERIFKPLGMVETAFDVPADKVDRLAQIYTSKGLFNPLPIPPDDVMGIRDVTKPTLSPIGGGGLVSTLADYLRFANCLLNGGELDGFRLLAPRTLQWMASDHTKPHMLPLKIGTSEIGARFGLGFRVVKEIGEAQHMTSKGAFGWSGAAQTHFSVEPEEDMLLFFMSQHLPMMPYPVRNRFVNLAFQSILD